MQKKAKGMGKERRKCGLKLLLSGSMYVFIYVS